MEKQAYKTLTERRSARSHTQRDCLAAFAVGGSICAIGEICIQLLTFFGMEKADASLTTTLFLIFLSAVLTGVGIFDKIARVAGAGTLVPVTGFANAVVSPALDTKSEGLIVGVGSKIFTVAGPVLLYGTLCGVLYGIIYYMTTLFGGM